MISFISAIQHGLYTLLTPRNAEAMVDFGPLRENTSEAPTIEFTTEMYQEDMAIKLALVQSKAIELKTVSTADKDRRASLFSQDKSQTDYAKPYTAVYNAPAVNLPPILKLFTHFVFYSNISTTANLPIRSTTILYKIIDRTKPPPEQVQYAVLDNPENLIYFSTEYFKHGLAIYKQFEPAIELATDILHKNHPELSKIQLKMLLQDRLLTALATMRHEDPWQDLGACQWSDCSLASKFAETFRDVDYGIKILGITIRPSWKIASWLGQIFPWLSSAKEEQGFGVYQTIFGLFKEAAEDPDSRQHFVEYFEPAYFIDDKAMMRALFEKPTMSCALVYDFLLTKLEKTVFQNPAVRTSPLWPPFIINRVSARQYALMSAATVLYGAPEMDESTKQIALAGSPFMDLWDFCSEILQEPKVFPDIAHYESLGLLSPTQAFLLYWSDGTKNTPHQ